MYTSKYLPVEGEIKEGDTVLCNGDWDTVVQYPLYDEDGYDIVLEEHGTQTVASIKLVKLFLISDDIELGDKYYHDDFHPYPEGDVADTNTKVMDAHMMVTNEGEDYNGDWSYKVIGEIITPGIREGQTFEYDQLRCLVFDGIWHNPPVLPIWPHAFARKIEII